MAGKTLRNAAIAAEAGGLFALRNVHPEKTALFVRRETVADKVMSMRIASLPGGKMASFAR